MATAHHNPKVDAYIAKAKPFTQPILNQLRKVIHTGCPEVEETIKWSRPFFDYKGAVLCNMSAFKEHCSFMFWGQEMAPILRKAGVVDDEKGMLRHITNLSELPAEKQLVTWVRQAAEFIAKGEQISPIAARNKVVKAPKPTLKSPPAFDAALRKNKKAAPVFAAFSPSCKREYIEWIVDAKREETRDQRIKTAVEWITEGKQRNWKYQK